MRIDEVACFEARHFACGHCTGPAHCERRQASCMLDETNAAFSSYPSGQHNVPGLATKGARHL